MQQSQPIVKDLVLIGGGHSHAIVMRMFGMKPLPGVRLTLITEASDTAYSGMLPGHVAGFYSHDECHINLRSLSQFAQAQLYVDKVIGLDLENKQVLCANRPPVAFDLLSIDIGSTPANITVSGATEYAIGAKPVRQFLEHWNQLLDVAESQKFITLAIVGGGAGGVELALSMQRRLDQLFQSLIEIQTPAPSTDYKQISSLTKNVQIHLFQRDDRLIPSYKSRVGDRIQKILNDRGVHLHLGETVCEVELHKVKCESGLKVECDRIFWVTQASAPDWLQTAGLETDENGFVRVNDTLQSVSHHNVFAAGDIATMVNYPRPKAGVFAVRQGKPLFNNLQRTLLGQKLKPFQPQKEYLSLIGTADGNAIANRGYFSTRSHKLLWDFKDWIDRRFMERFSNIPEMSESANLGKAFVQKYSSVDVNSGTNVSLKSISEMRCAGCGSKVSSTVLDQVLNRIKPQSNWNDSNILIGLDTPDDAAVVQVPAGKLMVHTIDYFRALINDPYIFGQISANHCLSDIFAMGAVPQSGLAIATIPYALESKVEETLYQLLSGAVNILNQSQTPLVGGHTTEGSELGFGLSCNGLVNPDQLLRKGGMQLGQALILTKPLGTGTLFAADMRRQTKNRWIDNAVESMLLSNQAAAACLLQHQATACTDVTGFGLLGHLMEMVKASRVGVELKLAAIPILEGARATIEKGIFSSLQPQNLRGSRYICNADQFERNPTYSLLFDPQTSGGLLASIPGDRATDCLASLQALGYHTSIIGSVTPAFDTPITLIE